MASDKDEYDWIFDFTLQFLESEKFDAAVMDFIDDKCCVFENSEENKFIYTDIHDEFCHLVETLIDSNLGEVGITAELFLESCQKSRNNRHINQVVFERLVSINDFQTFKKVMIRRNVELQIEAMEGYQYSSDYLESMQIAKDMEEKIIQEYEDCDLNDAKMQVLLKQSLQELELVRKQAELEQAELEQVLAISLAMEEERLRSLGQHQQTASSNRFSHSDSKESSHDTNYAFGDKGGDDESEFKDAKYSDFNNTNNNNTKTTSFSRADPKPSAIGRLQPLSRGFESKSSALPPIGRSTTMTEFVEVKRAIQDVILEGQDDIARQHHVEAELQAQLHSIDPVDAERRAKFMREQRDKIIQKKKAEREKKVAREEEGNKQFSQQKHMIRQVEEAVQRVQDGSTTATTTSDEYPSPKSVVDVEQESKRNDIRLALARRMKMDLIINSEEKEFQEQQVQFADLNKKIWHAERLRMESKHKELVLTEQIKKQQMAIAKNILKSSAVV